MKPAKKDKVTVPSIRKEIDRRIDKLTKISMYQFTSSDYSGEYIAGMLQAYQEMQMFATAGKYR